MIPQPADLLAARARLRVLVLETPLSELALPQGARLLLKLENRQRTNSFKPRGALNASLAARERGPVTGLVTFSSGNHGQAVALAARELGVPCVVVAHEDVRASKLAGMESLGATVTKRGLTSAERMERAIELSRENGYTLVPPYDHPDILCGQSTVAQEILEQAPEVTTIVVPVGGGGLVSGTALAASHRARIVGAEPEGADDARRSLMAGRLVRNDAPSASACDGLRNTCVGDLPWSVIRERVSGIVAVSEDEVRAARVAIESAGFGPVEPSGAASVAAVMSGRVPCEGVVVAIVSGGNAG